MSRVEKAQLLQWVVIELADHFPGIKVRPATAGKTAYIRQTRIPVWIIEAAQRQGATDADLLQDFPTLRAEDLAQARAYVRAHQAEIEREIRENEEA